MTWVQKNQRSPRINASGGRMDQSVTARLAQEEMTSRYPATGRYQMAVVKIRYSHNTWICSHRSACHKAPPTMELARTEMMNAISSEVRSAAAKYTTGITITAVASFDSTVVASEIGRDFQNSTLRSLRSAYRQSSRYQAA